MSAVWPELAYADWRDTCATLHRWTQVVGKVRLARAPWLNHSWHVPLYVTPRGLTTGTVPYDARVFQLTFDFVEHALLLEVSDGGRRHVPLRPQTVAAFHDAVLGMLSTAGLPVTIDPRPCEIPAGAPLDRDTDHAAYDPAAAERFQRTLIQCDRVFTQFRTAFLGKSSPVHFFWGSFDLAVTRFSGRAAPRHPGGAPGVSDHIMREAYSHEVSSAGFWPGGPASETPIFYSYAYPVPETFAAAPVEPSEASFVDALGEFVLPYDAVRTAADPDAALLAFLQSTYEAAANAAQWDRHALECAIGQPGVPRALHGQAEGTENTHRG